MGTTLLNNFKSVLFLAVPMLLFTACGEETDPEPMVTGNMEEYTLSEVGSSGVNGSATFEELDNGGTRVTVNLTGTSSGGDHPSHIHVNTAAEGGGIAIDLTNITGSTGESITDITEMNDGTPLSYAELVAFDGYINIHNSVGDLGTLLAQGDIGENELTGNYEDYDLFPVSDPNISGDATIFERVNGETLLVISLEGDATDSDHPAHIHNNNAADGGGIAIDLSNVMNGMSKTNITALNDGTAITYEELKDFDGYINVHNTSDDLGTLVAQGDIGINELTSASEEYPLGSVSDPNISGTATFTERRSGETLVVINLNGDASDSDHPSHIHRNTAAEGGGIAIDLSNVQAGVSKTNIAAFNDGTAVTYEKLIAYDGYINVHNSTDDLGTLVAQGDIGQNALTGEEMTYALNEVNSSGVSGTVTFMERINEETLVVISLSGTTVAGDHPSHIHNNDAATGGGIAIDLTNVNGATGESKTNVTQLNDGTSISYDGLVDFNGYVNIHQSASDLATIIAQGDIGANG